MRPDLNIVADLPATIDPCAPRIAIPELLAQMTAILNSPSEPMARRYSEIQAITEVLMPLTQVSAFPSPSDAPSVHWIGNTMMVV